MIKIFTIVLCFAFASLSTEIVGQEKESAPKADEAKQATPLEVVNKRMDAYNKHDLKAFLGTYSDDIQVYTYPDKQLGRKGKPHMRSIFEPMFKEAKVKVTIHHQIEQGKYVINEETVNYGDKETR